MAQRSGAYLETIIGLAPGTKWANAAANSGTLAGLSDVSITSPVTAQILAYLAANPGTSCVSDRPLTPHSGSVIGVSISPMFAAWIAPLSTTQLETTGVPWRNGHVLEVL
jgi:hypothetical protein